MSKGKRYKITKHFVDSVKPQGKEILYWDSQLPCFGLRVSEGGIKSFIIQYRNGQGRSRRLTLGRYGHLTVDQAKNMAKKELGRITEGHDPLEEKQTRLQEMTVSVLCDVYLEEGCRHKKDSTIYNDRGRIEGHIKPLLGNRKVSAVKRYDVEKMMYAIADGKTASDKKTKARGRSIIKGGKVPATKSVILLSAIYSFAQTRGLTETNPCRGVKKFPDSKRERFLSPKEFHKLGNALTEAEETEHPSAINALRMIIFTGCRKNEILSLKWSYIDFKNSRINLPDSKTGEKIIRLGAPALAILQSTERIEGNDYVFYGHKEGHHLINLQKPWVRIREKAGLPDLRVHDLRHSFASMALAGGMNLYVIGALLGHSSTQTTERYAHLADDPLKEAATRIAESIDTAMQATGDTENIFYLQQSDKK